MVLSDKVLSGGSKVVDFDDASNSVYLEKCGLSIGWLSAWYRTGDDDLSRAIDQRRRGIQQSQCHAG